MDLPAPQPIEPSDVPAVAAMVRRAIDEAYAGLYEGQAREFFHDYHTAEKIRSDAACGTVLVVKLDGRCIATGTLTADGEICRVYMEQACRRRGLGRRIVARLVEHARTVGHTQLRLCASPISLDFWRTLGWRLVGEDCMRFPDGRPLLYYDMLLELPTI